jgi:glycosyltransferase involved in cell wall biosynthesis
MARTLAHQIAAFDLAHLHSVFLWPTCAAARAARRTGVPYVLSPRGMLVKDLVRVRSRYIKTAWLVLVERANLAHAAAIHVTSLVEATELKDFGYRLKGRIFEVPNGVTVARQIAAERTPEQPYLIMLGRISWKKRIEIALEALKLVDGIRLVIAGGDDEGLSPALRDRAASLGVLDRVDVIGPVDGERKRQLLAGALALLMPSLSENFGKAALEAMAEGTPAIVVAKVGVADIVKKSDAGFVVAPTGTAFADAIRQLQSDPELRGRMSENARTEIVARYSWPAIAARMEREYQVILNDLGKRAKLTDRPCSIRSPH